MELLPNPVISMIFEKICATEKAVRGSDILFQKLAVTNLTSFKHHDTSWQHLATDYDYMAVYNVIGSISNCSIVICQNILCK